jgi:hypothetical protein
MTEPNIQRCLTRKAKFTHCHGNIKAGHEKRRPLNLANRRSGNIRRELCSCVWKIHKDKVSIPETERDKERQRGRETDNQRDRDRERQAESQRGSIKEEVHDGERPFCSLPVS